MKRDGQGKLDKYKARCVVQGFNQTYGIDYLEVAAPVTSLVGLRVVMTYQLLRKCKAHHCDVSQAFLHSFLDPRFNIVIELPPGYHGPKNEKYAKLHKSLYGLKQGAFDYFQTPERVLTSS